MDTRLLSDAHGVRSFALVFDTDDDVLEALLAWAREQKLSAASFSGLGAFRSVTLGFFDLETRDYIRIPIDDQVEVLALTGNVALSDGEPKVHAHVVVGRRDGTALGGHLMTARVRPTLEVVLVESPPHLQRTLDPATGLPLLDLRR
jgi:uncharacterized protein